MGAFAPPAKMAIMLLEIPAPPARTPIAQAAPQISAQLVVTGTPSSLTSASNALSAAPSAPVPTFPFVTAVLRAITRQTVAASPARPSARPAPQAQCVQLALLGSGFRAPLACPAAASPA